MPPGGRVLEPESVDAIIADIEQFVAQSHLFRELDEAGRARLLECGYVVEFDVGQTIIQQGDPGSTIYMLLTGSVAVHVDSGQSRVSLATLERGACVGEVSVLRDGPRTATVKAQESVEALAFEKHRIERILNDYPGIRTRLEALIEGRARDTIEKIVGS